MSCPVNILHKLPADWVEALAPKPNEKSSFVGFRYAQPNLPVSDALRVTRAGVFVAGLLAGVGAAFGPLFADHGEAHGDVSHSAAAIARLADGSLFVPKSVQRAIGVRTIVTFRNRTPEVVELAAKIVPDPGFSAVVQAAQTGTLEAAAQGFPVLGANVARGQLLGYLRPALTAIESSDQRTALAFAQKDLKLSKAQLDQYQLAAPESARLGDTSVFVPMMAEYEAAKKRTAEIESGLARRIPLLAPVAGVLSRTDVYAGRVVGAGDFLAEIVHPDKLWVSAVSYDTTLKPTPSAFARTADDRKLALAFAGESYRLVGQTLPLMFRILDAPRALAVGQPVTLYVYTANEIEAMLLPAASFRQLNDGTGIVWVHREPERFIPKKVRAQRYDAERVLVTAGLAPGERVVTDGSTRLSGRP